MSRFLDLLERFNRKERYFLFTQATGNRDFILSKEFREKLRDCVGLDVPSDARAFIDYHLDWLHACVVLVQENLSENAGPWINREGGELIVSTGNQEDIDLIIAYDIGSSTQLILIEAKAESSWTNKQMISKARRLAKIFGRDPLSADALIRPVFCLASPRKSKGLFTVTIP